MSIIGHSVTFYGLETEDFSAKKKKTSIKIVHFIGEPKHNVRKPSWDPFIPISTYSKLIVPLCEAKAQEGRIGLYDMV